MQGFGYRGSEAASKRPQLRAGKTGQAQADAGHLSRSALDLLLLDETLEPR
jgi:hypothetical protein